MMQTFKEKVLEIVRRIPKGQTLTYKEVAKKAGNPGAARSDGLAGEYNRGRANKIKLLKKEGALE